MLAEKRNEDRTGINKLLPEQMAGMTHFRWFFSVNHKMFHEFSTWNWMLLLSCGKPNTTLTPK